MSGESSRNRGIVSLDAQKFNTALDEEQIGMLHHKYRIDIRTAKTAGNSSNLFDIEGHAEDIIRFFTSPEYHSQCGGPEMTRETVLKQFPQLQHPADNNTLHRNQDKT